MGILWGIPAWLQKVNDTVGKYWWIILAAAVLLVIILFFTISVKNKRIRKLKRELKKTRTELETERTRNRNEEIFAPVTGSKDLFGAPESDETETVEIDAEPEPEPAPKKRLPADDEVERASQGINYYNKAALVSAKEGNVKFIVKYERAKDSWVIKKEGVNRVVRRTDTKEEAMAAARVLCKKYNANLVVHKKDGKFQKQ